MTDPSNEKAVVEKCVTPTPAALPVSGEIEKRLNECELYTFDKVEFVQCRHSLWADIVTALRSHPQAPASGEAVREACAKIADEEHRSQRLQAEQSTSEVRREEHRVCARTASSIALSIRALSPSQPASGEGKLREALEPFAKIADVYAAAEDDSFQLFHDAHEVDTRVTLGMCRAARAALSTPPRKSDCHAPLADCLDPECPPQTDGDPLLSAIHADIENRGRENSNFAVSVHHRNIVLSATARAIRALGSEEKP